MPPKQSEPQQSSFTPLLCTCGYDLTGLPLEGEAKCPECGLEIAKLKPPRSRWPLLVVLALLAFAPLEVFFLGMFTPIVVPLQPDPVSGGLFVLLATAASFLFISLPACVVFAMIRVRGEPMRERLGFAACMILIATITNVLVLMLFFVSAL
jgi:hypothetical protein